MEIWVNRFEKQLMGIAFWVSAKQEQKCKNNPLLCVCVDRIDQCCSDLSSEEYQKYPAHASFQEPELHYEEKMLERKQSRTGTFGIKERENLHWEW